MSYCRWSSDKFRSDVYVYACYDNTWTTHVAASKLLDEYPGPDPYSFEEIQKPDWQDKLKKFHEWLEKAERGPPPPAHAGKTFKDDTPQDCAATLRMLRTEGYHVPDGVIEELEQEKDE